jgi:ketosteroid isomerase-like protein
MTNAHCAMEEIVNRETRAWATQDVELLLTIIHPDIVWSWPPTAQHHDPVDWVFVMGRCHRERWRAIWQQLFDSHKLIHNCRSIRKIALSAEGDAAFAVVDIDTLWQDAAGNHSHWKGRVCKVYSLCGKEWKLIMHTGALNSPPAAVKL